MRSTIARHAVLASLEPRRLFAAGDLDASFGGGKGFVLAGIDAQISVQQVAIQSDGKTVLAGIGQVLKSDGSRTLGFGLTRLNADGSIDRSFGTNGEAGLPIGVAPMTQSIEGVGLTLAKDGSILFATNVRVGLTYGDGSASTSQLVRVSADGKTVSVLRSFTSDQASATQTITAIAAANDGDIYVGGAFDTTADKAVAAGAVVRLNADGSLDGGFDGDGYAFPTASYPGQTVTLAASSIRSLTLTNTGAIVGVAETADYSLVNFSSGAGGTAIKLGKGFEFAISSAGAIAANNQPADTKLTTQTASATTVTTTTNRGDTASYGKPWRLNETVAASGAKSFALNTDVNGFYNGGGGVGRSNATIVKFLDDGGRLIVSSRDDAANVAADAQLVLQDFTAAPAGDGTQPSGPDSFLRAYDFGGVDQILSARKLADGKLAFFGTTTDASGATKLVVGRIALAAPAAADNATIAGIVFEDASGNGVRDNGEFGVGGRTVYLDANNNGQLDAGEAKATTDNGGYYEFKNLPAGTFSVRTILPAGATATTFAGVAQLATTTANAKTFLKDFGTLSKPAPVVSATVVAKASPKSVQLKWVDAATNETAYRVERRYIGETLWRSVATLAANSTSYDDASVLYNCGYEYRIVAINAAGETPGSILTVHT